MLQFLTFLSPLLKERGSHGSDWGEFLRLFAHQAHQANDKPPLQAYIPGMMQKHCPYRHAIFSRAAGRMAVLRRKFHTLSSGIFSKVWDFVGVLLNFSALALVVKHAAPNTPLAAVEFLHRAIKRSTHDSSHRYS
jgi:hypothetical protein